MDLLKRQLYVKYEIKYHLLKSLIFNQQLTPIVRFYALYKLQTLVVNSSVATQINRCVLSGRSYNVLSKFKYSRFTLRQQTNVGAVVGNKRFSW
jgi:small subunit ribosomal protein S14